ncbi:MAG: LLM class flavin-dependent oxidoreductase [Deltaproteobacteria bacterium]|nr:LLM class flavin-dependent oxidoreductase [Deltaproteobacteria bacterium]MBI3077627.1 LLM class flavin-dependent oxidoreductase [Deltaproteobacteria bacterium]
MHYDVEFNSAAQLPAMGVVQAAARADGKGFGTVWKGEANNKDPLTLLSAMAAVTKRIQLGTAVVHMFARSPVSLGIAAATLNEMVEGRLIVGLGLANARIAAWHGLKFERPLRYIREYVEALRRVYSGEKVDYRGELITVGEGFRLGFRPPSYPLRVYLAALGPQMTRLAAQIADGVLINMANPNRIRIIVDRVRASAREAGRDPDTVPVLCKVRCSVNPDLQAARAQLKKIATFYSLAGGYSRMISDMGFSNEVAAIHDTWQKAGFHAAVTHVSDRMLDGLPLLPATSVQEVKERLKAYFDAGISRVIVPYVTSTEAVMDETLEFVSRW